MNEPSPIEGEEGFNLKPLTPPEMEGLTKLGEDEILLVSAATDGILSFHVNHY